MIHKYRHLKYRHMRNGTVQRTDWAITRCRIEVRESETTHVESEVTCSKCAEGPDLMDRLDPAYHGGK